MPSRREFLASAVATATYAAVGPLCAEEGELQLGPDINATLEHIACVLMGTDYVKNVEMHLVDNPKIGLTQWKWFHFNEGLTYGEYAQVETVNGELFDAMKRVDSQGDMGLDHLMLEGLVEGRRNSMIECMWETHYAMTYKLAKRISPFRDPDPEAVKEKMYKENYLRMRGTYTLQDKRKVTLTPLGRLGAGYGLATQRPMYFDHAEDPVIDAQAEIEQKKGKGPGFEEWVIRKRNEHFVKLIRENRRRLTHLLVGAAHDLRSDIAINNELHPEKISHIVVEVQGIK